MKREFKLLVFLNLYIMAHCRGIITFIRHGILHSISRGF